MHKAPIAHINPGMRWLTALREQHQIPGSQRTVLHRFTPILQFGNGAWCFHANSDLIDMVDQATAIETAIRGVTPITIRRPHQTQCVKRDILGLIRRQTRGDVCHRSIWRIMHRRGVRLHVMTHSRRGTTPLQGQGQQQRQARK